MDSLDKSLRSMGVGSNGAAAHLHNTTAQGLRSTKQMRIKKLHSDDQIEVPDSYLGNSNKELLCLEYVKNFRLKFCECYPKRKDLYLTARNEFGVEKFVCTTLRPTQLPYREVYGMAECAEFVARFLHYEPLEHPTSPPSCLPSSTQVLNWGVGDCFDFAILLTSYLLGAGYDAFMVIGYAPRWITLHDESNQFCPLLESEKAAAKDDDDSASLEKSNSSKMELTKKEDTSKKLMDEDEEDNEKEEQPERYKPKMRGVPESKYLRDLEEKRLAAEAAVESQWESDDDEAAAKVVAGEEEADDLHGQRVHAWVLIRGGKRAVEEMVFVEPTTGRVYPVSKSPYLGLEAMFNSKNYYVNVQGPNKPMGSILYDILNNDHWEYVLLDPQTHGLRYKDGEGEFGSPSPGDMLSNADITGGLHGTEEGQSGDIEDESVLDIPPSWVTKLSINRDLFIKRYPPDGQRTIFYRKAKLELYAETIHDTCMTSRLMLYKDRELTILKEVREYFTNRRDLLFERTRYPLEGKVKESFHPGRQYSLKDHVEWTGRRRELHFYVSARDDGLVSREEEFGHKIIERFSGRGDHLVYRSVTFWEEDRGNFAVAADGPKIEDKRIRKMTQKYERDPSVPADKDIAKRKYYLNECLIRTTYHYEPEAITSRVTCFLKERSTQVPKLYAQDERVPNDEREEYINAEKQCLKDLKELNNEVSKLLIKRRAEEKRVERAMPLFERARHRRHEEGVEEGNSDIDEEGDHGMVDYLTPFLQNISNPRNLTQEEATKARDNCLKALKDRLIERANIINNKLTEENNELSKKQANFERNQRDNNETAEEEFQRECQERVFRIQILERRLQQHEEAALKKYADMDEKLAKDPRLAILNDK